MNRRSEDGSDARAGSCDVQEVYVNAFANRDMTIWFTKAALERFHREEEYSRNLQSHEAQGRFLRANSPARAPGSIFHVVVPDIVVIALLGVDEDQDLKGVVDVDIVDKAKKRRP